jgi:hypothetical protein
VIDYLVVSNFTAGKDKKNSYICLFEYENGYEDVLGEDIQGTYSAFVEASATIPLFYG